MSLVLRTYLFQAEALAGRRPSVAVRPAYQAHTACLFLGLLEMVRANMSTL